MLSTQNIMRFDNSYYGIAAKYRQQVSIVVAIACFMLLIFNHSHAVSSSILWRLLDMLGLLLVMAATFGRIWASFYIRGYKDIQLITDGPYSLVRNPLYCFTFLGMVGISLASKSIPVILIITIFFLIYYPLVVFAEEQFLVDKFGQSFLDYTSQVPRFFPVRFKPLEPIVYQARPYYLRKSIQESVWFFCFYIIIHLITYLW